MLTLYQTQIDYNSYLLIKEPYTHALKSHLITHRDIADIIQSLQLILEQMHHLGYYLRTHIKMEDLVFVFTQLKIQNAGVFTLDRIHGYVDTSEAIEQLKEEMEQFLT